jgi:hypothetical protein
METSPKGTQATAVETTEDEAAQPWRVTTSVVWRGKLLSSLCLSARQLPTISPLVVWRSYEPTARTAPLVPRRRRLSS